MSWNIDELDALLEAPFQEKQLSSNDKVRTRKRLIIFRTKSYLETRPEALLLLHPKEKVDIRMMTILGLPGHHHLPPHRQRETIHEKDLLLQRRGLLTHILEEEDVLDLAHAVE